MRGLGGITDSMDMGLCVIRGGLEEEEEGEPEREGERLIL